MQVDRSLHVRHIEDRYWSPQGVFFEAVMNACIVFCNTASSIERERQIAEKLNIIATAASRPHSVLGKLIPPKYFWPMKTTNEDQSKVWFESHICWSLSGPPFEPILKSLEESGPYHPHPDHGNINN